MKLTDKELAEALNEVLVVCEDGHKGYQEAAHLVKEGGPLFKLFAHLALQRKNWHEELRHMVARVGGVPKKHGSAQAAAHRTLMDLKELATGKEERPLLEEVLRGEEKAIAHYERVMEQPIPAPVKTTLQVHLNELRNARKEVQILLEKRTPKPEKRGTPT